MGSLMSIWISIGPNGAIRRVWLTRGVGGLGCLEKLRSGSVPDRYFAGWPTEVWHDHWLIPKRYVIAPSL